MLRRDYLERLATGVVAGTAGCTSSPDQPPRTESDGRAEGAATRPETLVAGSGDALAEFGCSVALEGDTVLVGAWNEQRDRGPEVGAAYVFRRSGGDWTQEARLISESQHPRGSFGNSVALDGDVALVGAPDDMDSSVLRGGRAFVFERFEGEWTQQAILLPDDAEPNYEFGRSVALDGDTVLVGAPHDDRPSGAYAGSVYVFERANGGWRQQTKLATDDGDEHDVTGNAVALQGDTALVGAPNAGSGALGPGRAYVFERSNDEWHQQTRLGVEDAGRGAHVGASVALDGSVALVGAPKRSTVAEHAGAAFVFERPDGEWRLTEELAPADVDGDDRFGESVAIESGRALVGSYRDEDPNGPEAGATYVFERTGDGWTERTRLAPDGRDMGNHFGDAVVLGTERAVVGSPLDDYPGRPDAGSAYVFDLDSVLTRDVTTEVSSATDPDGDGRYEDVNGDGETTPGDATVLFERVFDGESAVTEEVSRFDFNGDGSVTPGDATVLFEETF